ncbi:sensor histidine kinase [Streptacidiphilus sp. EB129]|uniref:sensor histidine kinase n=1 Tax=Streptacidiphilus sp. EB129 TaxID=3156262 RepID=UPI003516F6E4
MRNTTAETSDQGSRRLWLPLARGLALFGQKVPQLALFVLMVASLAALVSGAGALLLPIVVAAVRRMANRSRRLALAWSGVRIAVPYRAEPEGMTGFIGRMRRFRWLLHDPATWRDMLWTLVDPVVGGVLALLPTALVLYGVEGLAFPFFWNRLTGAGYHDWYAGLIHVHGQAGVQAWLMIPLGLASIALGLWSAPRLLAAHGRFTRRLLAPPPGFALSQRVQHLSETRSEVMDGQAAELRRIERDLHDGAQARLVAMGMNLGAAEELLDTDPEAVRGLLAESRELSSRALGELRDLVRGIHPPVLSDRGLGDAVRALALDTPLAVEVVVDLPGRLSAPVESAAYFAVTELLTNVAKHADSARVWIDIRHDEEALRISVTDDGPGGADALAGSGLRGIERRLGAFDGILAVQSPVGGPTMVTMEMPCVLFSPKTSSC